MRLLSRSSLLLAALLCAVGGSSGGQAPRAASPAPPSAEVRELRDELGRLLRGPGRHGVLVVSLDRGDTLFSHNPDLPLAPASNLKLYSTAAALYYLGPAFRFSTYALGTGDVRDGVLEGDVVLYGTGDPSLSRRMLGSTTIALRALADSLHQRGVRTVRGDVVGDGSYFDDEWVAPGWDEEDRRAWYGAPIGALSFAENLVVLRVLPGEREGAPARLRTTPETEGLAVSNQVRTVSRGATRVTVEHGPDALVIKGQVRRGSGGSSVTIPVVDPANFAAAAFRSVLEERGIAVRGRVRTVREAGASAAAGGSPPPRVLAVHLSPPLSELALVTNHISHNLFADALLKTAGRVALGDGSFAGGARAVQYFLECEAGVDSAALRLVDGSGLSSFNRVTARTTIQLLDYMTRSPVWRAYSYSLPVAADRMGLRRMYGTAAAGNLRAKTGTIARVSSLSGYVDAANGERLAFSIIANDVPSTSRAKGVEDAIGARLASFTRPGEGSGNRERGPAGTPAGYTAAPAAPEPAPRPAAPTPAARTHRVRGGETLDGIARRYGTTVRALQRANPGLTPRRLQIGQRLKVP